MLSCLLECESSMDLGPPPDLIVGIPPPPIPSFLREPVDFLVASNGTCDLCGWAKGDDAQLVQIFTKYPVIEDLWYFGILSAVIGLVLLAVLVSVAAVRCREAKVKPVHSGKSSSVEKVHSSEPELNCSATSRFDDHLQSSPKSLWSSVKVDKGGTGGYVLQHHPVDPYHHHLQPPPLYDRVDYGSIVYSCPLVKKSGGGGGGISHPPPPPLPAVPPPPFCPSLRPTTVVGSKEQPSKAYYDHVLLRGVGVGGGGTRLPMVTRISQQHSDGRSAPV